MGQLFATSTQGTYTWSKLLSKEVVHAAQPDMKFTQFTVMREQWGKNAGESFLFDKYGNIDTQGTTLTETTTVPAHSYRLYQSTATLYERGKLIATLSDSSRELLKSFLLPIVKTERILQWTTRLHKKLNWLISPELLMARAQ